MAPQITLVMPTYNGMKFLPAAVNSLLEQDFQDWELIVSDDGSKDGTRDFLDTLTDPRIKVFKQEKNLGIFGNLNFLFSQATAPITQIFCQDDKLTSRSAVATVMNLWSGLGPEVGFLRCNHVRETFKLSKLNRFEASILPTYPQLVTPEVSDFYFIVFGCIPGNLSNVSLRTELVAQNGGYDQSLPYSGDFEFWSRIGRKYVWCISDADVMRVHEHEGQASKTLNYKGELLPQQERVISSLYSHLVQKNIPAGELRFIATINTIAPHFYIAVKRLVLKRDPRYLKMLYSVYGKSKVTFGNVATTFICLASLGGRVGSVYFSSRFLKRHVPDRSLAPSADQ